MDGYTVFVKLALQNQVSAGLLGMSAQFSKLNAQVDLLQAKLASIRSMAMVGGGLLFGGYLGLHIFDKALKYGEEYQHQLNIMNMAGMSQKEIAEAVGASWENTSKIMTSSATDNLRALMDMRNILGDISEAHKSLSLVTEMQAVLQSSTEGQTLARSPSFAQDFAFSVSKAIDIIGMAKSKETYEQEATEMSRVITAFQGRVTPRMYQSVFAYARQAKLPMDEEFKYRYLPTLMLEYAQSNQGSGGGSRGVGPMLAAMYRITNQGYISKASLPLWSGLGLMDKKPLANSMTTTIVASQVKNHMDAANDPFLWVQNTLMPAIKAKYGDNLSNQQYANIINQLFRGNQLAGNLATEFALKPYNFYRDAILINKALPVDQAFQKAIANDPGLARLALAKQWDNLMISLSGPIVYLLIPALTTLASGFNSLSVILMKYPAIAKTLSLAFIGLSSAMAIGGTVMLLTAAFRGLSLALTMFGLVSGVTLATLMLPLTAFGLVIYGLYKFIQLFDWHAVWASTKAGITNFFTGLGPSILSALASGLGNLGTAIAKEILSAISGTMGSLIDVDSIKGSQSQPIQVNSTVNLDGKAVANSVTTHQVKGLTDTHNYTSNFDPSMTLAPNLIGSY